MATNQVITSETNELEMQGEEGQCTIADIEIEDDDPEIIYDDRDHQIEQLKKQVELQAEYNQQLERQLQLQSQLGTKDAAILPAKSPEPSKQILESIGTSEPHPPARKLQTSSQTK
eukprot:30933_1